MKYTRLIYLCPVGCTMESSPLFKAPGRCGFTMAPPTSCLTQNMSFSSHKEHLSHTNGCISCDASEDRSLDELLAFIEGMEGGISGQGSPRAAKKQKKKHKKACL